jgi:hypothetical protein
MTASPRFDVVTFIPGLGAQDETAAHWLNQVTVRLRREVCWRWHMREGVPAPHADALPHPDSQLLESLDLVRHAEAKQQFFRTDITARFLTQQLSWPRPSRDSAARGSFGWVVGQLELTDAAAFTLALAVSSTVDGAVGPVMAACLDDASRTSPTLALAQKLWDDPAPVIDLADPGHALWSHALVQPVGASALPHSAVDWDTPLGTPPLIARRLLFPGAALPAALAPLDVLGIDGNEGENDSEPLSRSVRAAVARLKQGTAGGLRVVPVAGAPRAMPGALVARVGRAIGRPVARANVSLSQLENATQARALVALAWLVGRDLLLKESAAVRHAEHRPPSSFLPSLRALPVILYVPVADAAEIAALPREFVQPQLVVPRLGHADRVALWRAALGKRAGAIGPAIEECARRFRYERETILAIAAALRAERTPITADRMFAACRAEVPLDAGDLAQEVTPRFRSDELVLPPAQRQQFDEIHHAMRSLTEVHFGWGTGRAWNESGISVLFAGAPGTGKTMAAEVLAGLLEMPMFRIDLSQVVNKYIGETEKNLKRLFDLADSADTVLFFDECDALFGRRTEVRDAHDRYANVEISYLLERMERFKGLAILATNRRKDIDEAFLRRLRYTVEFPMPEVRERRELWQRLIPAAVDASEVDVEFLARQFPLAGGHIRSIVLNACLQTANRGAGKPKLTMDRLIVAVKREYDKLGRTVTLDQFGRHAALVERLTDA